MKTKALRLSPVIKKKSEKTARMMLVGVVLCCVAPFLFWFALQMQSSVSGVSMMEVVESNPLMGLNMIVSFTTPFCGYMLFLARKKVMEVKDFESVYLNLALLMIGQILSMNILYMCMFAFLLYHCFGVYKKSFVEAFKALNGKYVFQELGGSLLILVLFALICVLTLRLNFIA